MAHNPYMSENEHTITKLKPCPFCGEESVIKGSQDSWYINCSNIFCLVNCVTEKLPKQRAIKAWNSRKPWDESNPQLLNTRTDHLNAILNHATVKYAKLNSQSITLQLHATTINLWNYTQHHIKPLNLKMLERRNNIDWRWGEEEMVSFNNSR